MISPGDLLEVVCPRIVLRRTPVEVGITRDAIELSGDGLAVALSWVRPDDRLVFVLYKGTTGWMRFSLLVEA